MPYLNVVTNQSIADESKVLKSVSAAVAKASGKPESYVMISLETQTALSFAGTTAPAAMLDYRALGLPSDRQAFVDALCTVIENELGVPGNRTYISMTDAERQNWGWDHNTF